jgi:hypothetical protein
MADEDVKATRHRLFLETLRHREQEVLRYLAILGPAVGGFVWLLTKFPREISLEAFCAATIGLQGLLLFGAAYVAALGYNYRYLTFQLSKEEQGLKVAGTVLVAWPRTLSQWQERTKLGHYISWFRESRCPRLYNLPWCFPPEIISVFWWAFVASIVYVTAVGATISALATCGFGWAAVFTVSLGIVSLILCLLAPWHFGKKLRAICTGETAKADVTVGDGCPRELNDSGD